MGNIELCEVGSKGGHNSIRARNDSELSKRNNGRRLGGFVLVKTVNTIVASGALMQRQTLPIH